MKKRYWLFILIPIIFLFALPFIPLAIFFINRTHSTAEISQQQFDQMLIEGDVKDVLLVSNENLVEITLSSEALGKGIYQNELEEISPFEISSGPHFNFKVSSPEQFDQIFTDIQEMVLPEKRIGYRVEERSGIGSLLLNWGFILLILALCISGMLWMVFRFFWLARPKAKVGILQTEYPITTAVTQPNEARNFPVKVGEKTIFIAMDTIVSFQAKDNYVYIQDTDDNNYLTEYTLTELEEKLPSSFVRIHRSYIVNKLLIKEIRKYSGNRFTVLLNGKKSQQLVSSQSYAPKVKELMKF